MHYSKVVFITLFASATTISAIDPAHYQHLQARAYYDRLNARDPILDSYGNMKVSAIVRNHLEIFSY